MTENEGSDSSSSTRDEEELGNDDEEEHDRETLHSTINLIKNLLMIVS